MFRCKQFAVQQDKCAMKVSTDSMILGSWVEVGQAQTMLDIGTGTGILALMLSQKSADRAHIMAIDIDEDAAMQAQENVKNGPWPNKIDVICGDINAAIASRFDLIVSNPPYFETPAAPTQAYQTQAVNRQVARQFSHLSPASLFSRVAELLSPEGRFYCLYPSESETDIVETGARHHLFAQRIMQVQHSETSSPYVNGYMFSKNDSQVDIRRETLVIRQANNQYTPQFKSLCQGFYLSF